MMEPPASGTPERGRSCVHWGDSPGWVRRSISARRVLSPPAVTGRLGSGICKAVAPRDLATRARYALRPSIPRAASWSRRPQTIRPASGRRLEPTCRRSPIPPREHGRLQSRFEARCHGRRGRPRSNLERGFRRTARNAARPIAGRPCGVRFEARSPGHRDERPRRTALEHRAHGSPNGFSAGIADASSHCPSATTESCS